MIAAFETLIHDHGVALGAAGGLLALLLWALALWQSRR